MSAATVADELEEDNVTLLNLFELKRYGFSSIQRETAITPYQ
jgi:hypothetical protein